MPARKPASSSPSRAPRRAGARRSPGTSTAATVAARLGEIEHGGGAGTLELTREHALELSGLDKIFFPDDGFTKGDVMRYYATVADLVLPTLADRPLVLKRTPDGIRGEMFFQQNAPEHTPPGVRVADVGDGNTVQRRIIGGDLITLLYIVQLGCISVDPWLSRVGTLDIADYAILDLDPGPGASFDRIIDVARWIGETLGALRLHGVPKTSGSRGIHIAIPLPSRTTYATALALAEAVATHVVELHPRAATVERSIERRPTGSVYIDCLQNMRAKSVAGAYAVRAKPGATVSAPLDWQEVRPGLDLHAFTLRIVPERVRRMGDLWGAPMRRRNTAAAVRAAIGHAARGAGR